MHRAHPHALADLFPDLWFRLLAIIATSLSLWLFAVLLVKGWLVVACFTGALYPPFATLQLQCS
jgi:hypothetical protein